MDESFPLKCKNQRLRAYFVIFNWQTRFSTRDKMNTNVVVLVAVVLIVFAAESASVSTWGTGEYVTSKLYVNSVS